MAKQISKILLFSSDTIDAASTPPDCGHYGKENMVLRAIEGYGGGCPNVAAFVGADALIVS